MSTGPARNFICMSLARFAVPYMQAQLNLAWNVIFEGPANNNNMIIKTAKYCCRLGNSNHDGCQFKYDNKYQLLPFVSHSVAKGG